MDFHDYGGVRIPVMTGKSARAFYNLPDDEIDRLRCGTEFTEDGDCMPGGYGSAFQDSFAYIDDAEIKERCEFAKRQKASILHLMMAANVPCKDQNGHGYCWSYGAISAVEANRLVQGLPYERLAPHSVAAGVMNGRDRGGWAEQALEWAEKYGIVPERLWPRHSRNHRLWQQEDIKTEAAKYKPQEWVNIPRGDMRALRSLLASNFACGMGLMWWGHLIMFGIVDWSDKHGWLYGQRNSHGARFGNDGWCFHTESSAKHGGGSTVRVAA